MSTFISIYILAGLLFMVWLNYKHSYLDHLRKIGKGDMGLVEFTFSCLALLVVCILAWPLALYVILRNIVKGVK